MNTTIHVASPTDKISWYDSIPFIADLHCDALLWDRNFLQHHDYGHVDLPRMQEANEAFQVFTVVSKTPRNQNYDKNTDETDQIALLSFAQLKSPADWFSVKSRALHQCEQLHEFASKSNGAFRVITNQQQLKQFIKDREQKSYTYFGYAWVRGCALPGR
jgi:membrane dipeptidase